MSRLTLVLVAVIAALAGGLGVSLTSGPGVDEAAVRAIATEVVAAAPKPEAGLSQPAVEAIVADYLARQPKQELPQSTPALDVATLGPMIESYLIDNPRVLQRVNTALTAELTAERKAATATALAELQPALYDAPGQVVLGNPEGDVTIVEMFDYNCGYCRQALPDLAQLLEQDKGIKLILKELPILSQGSLDAAKVAVQVAETDVDYFSFHQALFTSRGQVDKAVALKAATELGLSPVALEMGMTAEKVAGVIQESYRIADRLNITGTPTFIIGDEIIPGAIPLEQLKLKIANMRACGSTTCPAVPG
jgi:protein-disulfide isomerase